MELEQLLIVMLILVIVYTLLQISNHQQQTAKTAKTDRVVYLQAPYFGYNFVENPLWRGPRPGRPRWRRRHRRRFRF